MRNFLEELPLEFRLYKILDQDEEKTILTDEKNRIIPANFPIFEKGYRDPSAVQRFNRGEINPLVVSETKLDDEFYAPLGEVYIVTTGVQAMSGNLAGQGHQLLSSEVMRGEQLEAFAQYMWHRATDIEGTIREGDKKIHALQAQIDAVKERQPSYKEMDTIVNNLTIMF